MKPYLGVLLAIPEGLNHACMRRRNAVDELHERSGKLLPLRRMRVLASIVVSAIALCGCDSRVEWRDGNYEVVWIDTQTNRSLYRSLNDSGDGIGRVGPEVVAVGSNEEYIVAKQRSLSDGSFSYYIVDRKKDDPLFNGNEIAEGPFSVSEFNALKKERRLPEFSATF